MKLDRNLIVWLRNEQTNMEAVIKVYQMTHWARSQMFRIYCVWENRRWSVSLKRDLKWKHGQKLRTCVRGFAYMCICTFVRVRCKCVQQKRTNTRRTHEYTHRRTHWLAHTHTHMQIHAYICNKYICGCVSAHIQTHVYIYIHIIHRWIYIFLYI